MLAPLHVNQDNSAADNEELTVTEINNELAIAGGVTLDQLMNPSKVTRLHREINNLRASLASTDLSSTDRSDANKELESKLADMRAESKLVMQDWLKNIFIVQAVIAAAVSLVLVYDAVPGYNAPLAAQALGFWSWWLFIIPSLR
jgi:hypothetical protein